MDRGARCGCLNSHVIVHCRASAVVEVNINGEFDPGSGRTLAACLTHASRTVISKLALGDQWRTGE
jgi:hypothetical protein